MSKFKVGDRVKSVDDAWLLHRNVGKTGTVSAAVGRILFIQFDDKTCDSAVARDLQLLPQNLDTEALIADLKALHADFAAGPVWSYTRPLEAIITKHFGLVWTPFQEGRWVEKENAA